MLIKFIDMKLKVKIGTGVFYYEDSNDKSVNIFFYKGELQDCMKDLISHVAKELKVD